MSRVPRFFSALAAIFDADDDPEEPFYDPVHLGATLIVVMVVLDALYWLLWTLLVYEGGAAAKIQAAWSLVTGAKTLSAFGYQGSFDAGAFQGWAGNLGALILCLLVLAALHSIYRKARLHSGAREK